MLHPPNAADPADAVTLVDEQCSAAPGVPVSGVRVKCTVDVSVVMLPPASSMPTTGCEPSAEPPVTDADGCVVKASWTGVPAMTENEDVLALGNPGASAFSW